MHGDQIVDGVLGCYAISWNRSKSNTISHLRISHAPGQGYVLGNKRYPRYFCSCLSPQLCVAERHHQGVQKGNEEACGRRKGTTLYMH